jgi:hypothetical protein
MPLRLYVFFCASAHPLRASSHPPLGSWLFSCAVLPPTSARKETDGRRRPHCAPDAPARTAHRTPRPHLTPPRPLLPSATSPDPPPSRQPPLPQAASASATPSPGGHRAELRRAAGGRLRTSPGPPPSRHCAVILYGPAASLARSIH